MILKTQNDLVSYENLVSFKPIFHLIEIAIPLHIQWFTDLRRTLWIAVDSVKWHEFLCHAIYIYYSQYCWSVENISTHFNLNRPD